MTRRVTASDHFPNRTATAMDRTLVIVRHGQSEWNLLNLFTGWRDVDLSPNGIEEARTAGKRIKAKGLRFGIAFTSALKRPSAPSTSCSASSARAACKPSRTRR